MGKSEKNILIVDDDSKLIDLLSRYLKPHGWQVFSATSSRTGLNLSRECHPIIAILDVMMPEMDGIELLRQMRKESDIPIIMLTAKEDVEDRIRGLRDGADDYIVKPVDPGELLARIESVLRRSDRIRTEAKGTESLRFGELEINFRTRSATVKGESIPLTSTEFDILQLFSMNNGTILSRNDIMDRLRGHDWNVYDRSIDIIISRLRQKLGDDPKNPKYVKTVWGEGYVFVGEGNNE